jgi:hypothetical protein
VERASAYNVSAAKRWQEFERLGFDSVWDCDHFNQPSQPTGLYSRAGPLLAALAVRTDPAGLLARRGAEGLPLAAAARTQAKVAEGPDIVTRACA